MTSPEKVDFEGTEKPHRHAEYYFADIIFQVSGIYDSDEANCPTDIRSRTSYSESHVATLQSNQRSFPICFCSQHPPTAAPTIPLRDQVMIDLFFFKGLRNQISHSYCV
jgi:hypothetical protein